MSGSFVAMTIVAFIFKVLSVWLGSEEWLPFYRKASYGCRFSDFYSLPLGQEEIGCIYNMALMRGCSQYNGFLSSHTLFLLIKMLLFTSGITWCLQAEEMMSKNDWEILNRSILNSAPVTETTGSLSVFSGEAWLEHANHKLVDHKEFVSWGVLCGLYTLPSSGQQPEVICSWSEF